MKASIEKESDVILARRAFGVVGLEPVEFCDRAPGLSSTFVDAYPTA
jgi:hypothetical protein